MISRRNLIGGSAILAGAAAVSGRVQAAAIPEAVTTTSAGDAAAARSVKRAGLSAGRDAQRLDAALAHEWRLEGIPSRRRAGGARDRARHEGASVGLQRRSRPARPSKRVEGDKVRIFVTNKLPEHTTMHWHGMLVPNGMDGVGGLTQPHIKPGKTFVYEFVLQEERHVHVPPACRRDGADGDGHDGIFRRASARSEASCAVDRDFVFLMSSYDIDPGSYMPKVMTMTDFNLWTWNSRVFPGIDPLVVRQWRPRARAHRQSHHDQSSDPHARLPLRGDLHRRRLDSGKRAHARSHDRRAGRRHARLSSSSPTSPATGRSIATSRTTP